MSRVAEKVPGWVESLLIPTLEAKVRSVVAGELGKLEKTVDARFDGVEARFEAVYAKIDSIEKQLPTMKELAEIKARLNQIERTKR